MKEIITTIKRLLWLGQKIGRKNKTLFIAALIAVAVTSIITAYIPQAIGNLVDNFSQEHFPVMGIITIGILYLFTEIFTYFRKFFVERAATDAWNKLTCLNIDRLLHIDLG